MHAARDTLATNASAKEAKDAANSDLKAIGRDIVERHLGELKA